MKSYIIGWARGPAQSNAGLDDVIKTFPLAWRYLDSTWIIKTDGGPRQVRDHIKPHLGPTDQLLVLELSGEGAWTGLNDEAIDWLVENL